MRFLLFKNFIWQGNVLLQAVEGVVHLSLVENRHKQQYEALIVIDWLYEITKLLFLIRLEYFLDLSSQSGISPLNFHFLEELVQE